jgi:hypothetical protein
MAAIRSSSGGRCRGSRGGAAANVAHPHRRGAAAGAAPTREERETVDGASDQSDTLSLALLKRKWLAGQRLRSTEAVGPAIRVVGVKLASLAFT